MLRRGRVQMRFDSRKLLGDAKQQRDLLELTSERLPEILRKSKRRRKPTVTGAGYTMTHPYPGACEIIRK